MLVTSIAQEKHDKTTRKQSFNNCRKIMHLKRIMFCMVITFVFIMKARFVKAITLLLFNKTSLV